MKIKFEDIEVLSIAPEGVKVGDMIQCGTQAEIKTGNVLPLSQIPDGTIIYNVESKPGDGGKFARSSGGAARVLSKFGDKVKVMLPSKKETLLVSSSAAKMNAVDHPFGNRRSSRKSKARPISRNAPPGRKVGMVAARRTGRRKK
jgi:large subunit ribosomal protein L2